MTYPLDISKKRQARTVVATRAERVLEALYQDAVRQRIDDVYGAFVTALAARQTERYAKVSADKLVDITDRNEQRLKKGDISLADFNQIKYGFLPPGWACSMRRRHTRRPSLTWDRS